MYGRVNIADVESHVHLDVANEEIRFLVSMLGGVGSARFLEKSVG